jgi:hypothetical protein
MSTKHEQNVINILEVPVILLLAYIIYEFKVLSLCLKNYLNRLQSSGADGLKSDFAVYI